MRRIFRTSYKNKGECRVRRESFPDTGGPKMRTLNKLGILICTIAVSTVIQPVIAQEVRADYQQVSGSYFHAKMM